MLTQKCKVCGKEFETRQSNYTLCSEECRAKRNYENNVRNKKVNKERYRELGRKRRWSNAKVILCQICGENVPPHFENGRMCRKRYHEECVIREAIKAVKRGEKFDGSSKTLTLAYNQGLCKRDILEYMEELK